MSAPFTLEYLASIIELRDGVMIWKRRGSSFDLKYAGKPVLLRLTKEGYRTIRVKKRDIFAHRAIWALHYGAWPVHAIDHINRDRTDNRIGNLRDVPTFVNNLNKVGTQSGIYWHAQRRRWVAQISRDGNKTYLGSFISKEAALRARREGERQIYGYVVPQEEWSGSAAPKASGGWAAWSSGADANSRTKQCHIAHDGTGL